MVWIGQWLHGAGGRFQGLGALAAGPKRCPLQRAELSPSSRRPRDLGIVQQGLDPAPNTIRCFRDAWPQRLQHLEDMLPSQRRSPPCCRSTEERAGRAMTSTHACVWGWSISLHAWRGRALRARARLGSRAVAASSACREAMRSSMGSRPAAISSTRLVRSLASRCQRRVLRSAEPHRARPTMALETQHPLPRATLADM